MDMDLDDIVIGYANHAITDGLQIGAQFGGVALFGGLIDGNDILGAIGKGDILFPHRHFVYNGIHHGFGSVLRLDCLALQGQKHTFHNNGKALTARIDHPCLL